MGQNVHVTNTRIHVFKIASEMLCCDQQIESCVVANDLFKKFEGPLYIPAVPWSQYDGQNVSFELVTELRYADLDFRTENIESCRLGVESQRPSVSPNKVSERFKVGFFLDDSNCFRPIP